MNIDITSSWQLGKDLTNKWACLSTKVVNKKSDSLSVESLFVVLG